MRKFNNRRGECQFGFFSYMMLLVVYTITLINASDTGKIMKQLTDQKSQYEYQIAGLNHKLNQVSETLDQINQRIRRIEDRNIEKSQ